MKLNASSLWAMEGEILLNYSLLSLLYQSQTKLLGRIEVFSLPKQPILLALMELQSQNDCYSKTALSKKQLSLQDQNIFGLVYYL